MNNIKKILTEFIDGCKFVLDIPCQITFSTPEYISHGVESIKKYLNKKITFNELIENLKNVQNDLEEEYYYYELDNVGDFIYDWSIRFKKLIDLIKKEHGK